MTTSCCLRSEGRSIEAIVGWPISVGWCDDAAAVFLDPHHRRGRDRAKALGALAVLATNVAMMVAAAAITLSLQRRMARSRNPP